MTETKRFSLVKPTLDTLYHIDYDWWKQNDREWRVHMISCLSPEHQELFSKLKGNDTVDWVDPQTAEVQRVDGLQHLLITDYANRDDFITERTSLVEAIFRLFLVNGNTPLTAVDLGDRLNRPPLMILRTISGIRVYKGIRPVNAR